MTAVEFILSELKKYGSECPKYELNYVIEIPTHILTELEEQAKAMEKEQMIEFACDVYDKYNFGTQEISFREECEQFKS